MKQEPLSERNLRFTVNDNDFHHNKKHTFYTQGSGKSSHKTMPTYMRHLENPKNRVDFAKSMGKEDTMTIIYKNKGWITVCLLVT